MAMVSSGMLVLSVRLLVAFGFSGNASDAPGRAALAEPDQADLALTITDNIDPVSKGDVVIYVVTVFNSGPASASAVRVRMDLPGAVNRIFEFTNQGVFVGRRDEWVVGQVPAGATRTLLIFAAINPDNAPTVIQVAGRVMNTPEVDPHGANDQAVEDTTVQGPDLVLTIDDNMDPVAAGATVIYAVSVRNIGPGRASGVQVHVPLPDGTSFRLQFTNQGSYAPGTGVWTVGLVPPGEARTLLLFVDAGVEEDEITISGTASNTPETDIDRANNEARERTTVIGSLKLMRTRVRADGTDTVPGNVPRSYAV